MTAESKSRTPGGGPASGNTKNMELPGQQVVTRPDGARQAPPTDQRRRALQRVLWALRARETRKPDCWIGHCPSHQDRKASLSLWLRDGILAVHCFAGCSSEAIFAELERRGFREELKLLRQPKKHQGKRPEGRVTNYRICDLAGNLVAIHRRVDHPDGTKSFTWLGPDGSPGLGGRPVAELPLYRCETLRDVQPGAPVFLTEGEKACDALGKLGCASVATVCGAAATPSPEVLKPLLPYEIYLWPDADEPGSKHMARIAQTLAELGGRVRIIHWAEAEKGGDAYDFVERYGGESTAKIKELLDAAQPFKIRDISTSELLHKVRDFIAKYVILSEQQRDILALWVLHTYAIDAAEYTPYLVIISPEPRCGKSRLLEVLGAIVKNPWLTSSVTAAALLRKTDRDHPVLLLDELDMLLTRDKELASAVVGLLNAGFRRGGKHSLCVPRGKDFDVVDFDVFSPKVVAYKGSSLPPTVADRSLFIRLRRKLPSERVAPFRGRVVEAEAGPLREELEAWALKVLPELAKIEPEVPEVLDDRTADVVAPLLAIAAVARGEWVARAQTAVVELGGEKADDVESVGVRLLRDIRAVFEERGVDAIASAELVSALRGIEVAPWAGFGGSGLNQHTLGRLLKAYGVRPESIRVGARVLRGYRKASFFDSWSRYLPSPHPPVTATSATTATSLSHNDLATPQEGGVADCCNKTQAAGAQALSQSAAAWGAQTATGSATPHPDPPGQGELFEPREGEPWQQPKRRWETW